MATFHLKIKSGSNSSGHYDYVIRDKEKLKDIDREQKEMYTSLFLILSDFRTKDIYFIG